MPKEVKGIDEVLRQGEWFFKPVSDEEILRIKQSAWEHDSAANCEIEDGDHVAALSVASGRKLYVTGAITHDRHKTIILPRWYEVIRNKEKITSRNSLSWD